MTDCASRRNGRQSRAGEAGDGSATANDYSTRKIYPEGTVYGVCSPTVLGITAIQCYKKFSLFYSAGPPFVKDLLEPESFSDSILRVMDNNTCGECRRSVQEMG